jgi:hypothetical protein
MVGGGLATALVRPIPLRAEPAISDMSPVFRLAHSPGLSGNHHHGGIDALIDLFGYHGLKFHRSSITTLTSGPDGVFGPDDVVMMKVNSQWEDRGMTNVDLVRGLSKILLEHPEGFTGEIVFVENAHFRDQDFEGGNAFNWQQHGPNDFPTNAENRTDTFETVINDLKVYGKITGYDWTGIRYVENSNPDDHETDGYFVPSDPTVEGSYARFTTEYGTRINFKYGIWTGSGYDQDRLKLINFPVLKDHSIYKATICCKNYMGVIADNADYHSYLQSRMGLMIGTTRVPDLNVVDAMRPVWTGGPRGYDSTSVEQNMILASADPAALDYHAAKHILYPMSGNSEHHPDNASVFRNYLENARAYLRDMGLPIIPELSDAYVLNRDYESATEAAARAHRDGVLTTQDVEVAVARYEAGMASTEVVPHP